MLGRYKSCFPRKRSIASLVNTTLKSATLGSGSFQLKDQTQTAVLSGKVSMLLAPFVDYSRMIFR